MAASIIVIGAGVLGCATAFELTQRGRAVTVVEASRVGSGTSSCSFAWLNASNKTPAGYHALNVAGMRAHRALRGTLGSASWLHDGGGLEIEAGADAAALEAKVKRLRDWDYPATLITPEQLAALEPDIDLHAIADPVIAYAPEEGWLDPVLFAQSLMRAAMARGAVLRNFTPVADLMIQAGQIRGVVTQSGERIVGDLVVNCAGRWCNETTRDAALHIPLAPRLGLLAFTPPAPVTLSRVLRTPIVDVRPDGAGRLMLHDNAMDHALGFDTVASPDLPQAQAMAEAAARLFPAIAGLRAEAARIVTRPVPGDGYSAVGWVPGVDGLYLAVTHSAVTLSAHLGSVIAEELLGGAPDDALAPFRPARFFGGNAGIAGGAEALTHAG
jgi:glycine/D-amino acid oxidase-like deaminating enzyme